MAHARSPWQVALIASAYALALARVPAASAADQPAPAFESAVRPLLKDYCLTCHSSAKHKGDVDLEQHVDAMGIRRHPRVWQRVLEQLSDGEMPPEGKPRPSAEEAGRLIAWVQGGLDEVAHATAGDPGPVVLRRLSNAEYTYTVRDLTGVTSLDPVREFPVDGAAGEGFSNTGQALVMSPALAAKYLDAGKLIAGHAVLLPDGLRFSPAFSRRDWTEEILAAIRGFYAAFTAQGGTDTVTMQGIVLDKNQGGRLPLEKYLAAALELRNPGADAAAVALSHGLNARYLATLAGLLDGGAPSLILDPLRARWKQAGAGEVAGMASEIAQWQKALWRFNGVGQIGKKDGPRRWLEAVAPLADKQEVHLTVPAAAAGGEVVVQLCADEAAQGRSGDLVVWQQPKLVIAGQPPLLLRDVRAHVLGLQARRDRRIAATAKALRAAGEVLDARGESDLAALARRHGLEPDALTAWLGLLGLGTPTEPKLDLMAKQLTKAGAYDFVTGWGSADTPSLVANSTDQQVRIPGNLKGHGVVLHPSPTLAVAVGWRSPVAAAVRIAGTVTHAHPECGNGVTWALELRRGDARLRLASGEAHGPGVVAFGPFERIAVRPGDLISLLVGPRGGSHACALTDIEFTLSSEGAAGQPGQEWSLTREVSPDVLAGNPHADLAGHAGVWHFYSEPLAAGAGSMALPSGCLLARWLSAAPGTARDQLADALQALLTSPAPVAGPDAELRRALTALTGPLSAGGPPAADAADAADAAKASPWGIEAARFGKRPDGSAIDGASLCMSAPGMLTIRLPAELAAGCELVTTGVLDGAAGADGCVRLQAVVGDPQPAGPRSLFVVGAGGPGRARLTAAFDEFRALFPAALCYTKIVPVDEVVTLTLFYREDDQLSRLMLDAAQRAALDRLWDELHFVSQDALTQVDAFEQLWQYATQDGDPSKLEPMRGPIMARATAFRQQLIDAQPRQLDAAVDFAGRAWRRPLSEGEASDLHALYRTLRQRELPHDEALRLILARILVGPAFLYRAERSRPGTAQGPVDAFELANRLSYFLWSSQGDDELRAAAASGRLLDPEVLAAQARRMLRDPRMRRMAIEFGCSWLHIRDFDTLDEKSERHFPGFAALRGPMYEEAIRFFTDFFQSDRTLTSLLDADDSFVDPELAAFYGLQGVRGSGWQHVEGLRAAGRGGILGLAATLAKQSGASRTSPILRGNWVAEVLLGDRLPRPPKDVPPLPSDEADEALSVRQLTEKHASDPRCAGCHVRIDAFGFALEGFDAIGRLRTHDLGTRAIDAAATVMDGTRIDGLDGLRGYLLGKRRDAFLRQFCRKLLGYALGRSVQLSDEPLLSAMRQQLAASGWHVGSAIDMIVRSRQFREIRGRDALFEE
jgi:hypothetical protein